MRILLADHHAEPRWALKTALAEVPGCELVGEAKDGWDLVEQVRMQKPDLVLIDHGLPVIAIEDLISQLHAVEPRPIVIVMSSKVECSRQALRAGADAFITKTDTPDWLLQSLRKYIITNQ